MEEERVGRKICRTLDKTTESLSDSVISRLEAAREKALSVAKTENVVVSRTAGRSSSEVSGSPLQNVVIPLLTAGLIALSTLFAAHEGCRVYEPCASLFPSLFEQQQQVPEEASDD